MSGDVVHGHGVGRRNSNIVGRCQFEWWGTKCDLVNDVRVFLAKGHVVTCDPHEIVFDDLLRGEHVGLCILYCLVTMSTMMTI